MKLHGVCVAMVVLLGACAPPRTPESPPDVEYCDMACEVLLAHGCEEGVLSRGGVVCQQWCSEYHAVEYMKPWASCVAVAADVDAVRECGVEC